MYKDLRIAVVGDFMVDEWWPAESIKIAPEAPVLDVMNPSLQRRSAGGAGNVVKNLLSLGASVDCYGIFGQDEAGHALWNELTVAGADWKVEPVKGFETHRKIRYMVGADMLFRISKDRDRAEFPGAYLFNYQTDALIVADYNKGVMTPKIINAVMSYNQPIFVDPKFDNFFLYQGATIFKPNAKESVAAMQRSGYEYSIAVLKEKLAATNVVVTLGREGMEVIDKEGDITDIPGREVEVADVTGAGDTAMAVLSLEYLRNGGDIVKAAYLANYACSLVVQKRGTAVVTVEELMEAER